MGGNQLQIFNGILLNVATVTIESEETGFEAVARAASGRIVGSMLGSGRGSTLGHSEAHLQELPWAPKLNRAYAQSLGMNSMTDVSWSSSKKLTLSSSSTTEYESSSTAKASVASANESTD